MVGIGHKLPVLVLVSISITAYNINRMMIHSILSIPIIIKNLDINSEWLNELQGRLQYISYIIINEKSMISWRILAIIDMWLRQAFFEHNNEPFSGRSVIMFDDFGQLPPVCDLSIYTNILREPLFNDSFAVYKLFREMYKFDVIQRQSENSRKQQDFKEILLRLHNGESTLDNWKILTTRLEDKLSRMECNSFSNTMFVLTKWSDVDIININQLRSLNSSVTKIQAKHTSEIEAKMADSDLAYGLKIELLLARNARVILTANLWTEFELVNGSMRTVQDILFKEGQKSPFVLIAVLISFNNYKNPTITSLENVRVVPIAPIRRT